MSYMGIDLDSPNKFGRRIDYTRFKNLARNMPDLTCLILDKFVNLEKSSFVYDFHFLDPTPESVGKCLDNHPMFILSNTENDQILSHRVVKRLTNLKWNGGEQSSLNSTPIVFFSLHFIFFLVYLVSITLLIILVNNSIIDLKQNVNTQTRSDNRIPAGMRFDNDSTRTPDDISIQVPEL